MDSKCSRSADGALDGAGVVRCYRAFCGTYVPASREVVGGLAANESRQASDAIEEIGVVHGSVRLDHCRANRPLPIVGDGERREEVGGVVSCHVRHYAPVLFRGHT